jgi:hypothetical protein
MSCEAAVQVVSGHHLSGAYVVAAGAADDALPTRQDGRDHHRRSGVQGLSRLQARPLAGLDDGA